MGLRGTLFGVWLARSRALQTSRHLSRPARRCCRSLALMGLNDRLGTDFGPISSSEILISASGLIVTDQTPSDELPVDAMPAILATAAFL